MKANVGNDRHPITEISVTHTGSYEKFKFMLARFDCVKDINTLEIQVEDMDELDSMIETLCSFRNGFKTRHTFKEMV